ncbi:MAG: phosphoglycerate dehydrogenase [Epsilonproteobacteria bacterium]|nr:phosphoglycerate dehydrogenase [Campylobacterota bacterium]
MSKAVVVVCDHIHQSGIDILKSAPDIELLMGADLPKDKLLEDLIPKATLAITRSPTPVDKNFLDKAKNLKAVIRAGVGVDNIDIEECSRRGIVVMNIPTANTIAAVELTMTHMLACARKFPYAHNQLKLDRIWRRQDWYGIELYGKKLGIIGFGNIGSRVGVRAKAFGMHVITYDPYIDPKKATDLDIEYTTNFDDILKCDFITIHTPKTKETIGMISKEEIAKMKDGVILINCARGGLYDEDALYEGLKSGKIAMAGIDVFEKEPTTDNKLLDLDNVTVTAHLGANTVESQRNIATQAAENALLAIRGISYPNALNLPIKENELPQFVKPYLELSQKIGNMAAQLTRSGIKAIKVVAEGEIADYIDSLVTFAIVGVLKESMADNINYVNAEFIANERGIEIEREKKSSSKSFKNLVTIKLLTNSGSLLKISGTIFEDRVERIVDIDGYSLEVEPKGRLILFKNNDKPGVIGAVGTIIAKYGVNIADFRLGRDQNGLAMAVIRVDNPYPKELIKELESLDACLGVRSAIL